MIRGAGARREWAPLLYAAPAQSLVVLLIFVPRIFVFWLSLQNFLFRARAVFVGFDNYTAVLSDPNFRRAFLNSAILVVILVLAELLLGLGTALLVASGIPSRPVVIAAILAPHAVAKVATVVVWKFLFDLDIGPVSRALMAVGSPPLEWSVFPSHGLALIGLLSIWQHTPFTFIILYAARLAIPNDLYEAAEVDGASPFQQFLRITLPLLSSSILIATLFRFILAFRMFSEVWLLTKGGPARLTEVLGVYLYVEAFRYDNYGAGAATGWLLLVASLAVAVGYLRRLYFEAARSR